MKTLAIIFFTTITLCFNGFTQNRIQNWDIEKISSIRAEFNSNDGKTYFKEINNKASMDSVFTFLKEIEFREANETVLDKSDILKQWSIKLIFRGQQDQIIFCPDYATIGKTLFSIDRKVVKDLKKLLTNCKKC